MQRRSQFLIIVLAAPALFLHGATLTTVAHVLADVDPGPAFALHQAADRDDSSKLEQLLAGGVPIEERDERKRTALHRATIAGAAKAAETLLDHGADPNALAEDEMTALHFAAMLGRAEIAGLLTRRGAKTELRNASGMMPIHLAASDKVVRVLVGAGADVNALTSKGLTPLHTARHGLVARALIDSKGDLRIRNPKGRTAMEIAGIETLEKAGLSIHSLMLGRLRGVIGQMPVTFTNISAVSIQGLKLTARSDACTIDVTPPVAAELRPGQNADMVMTMTRDPMRAEGEYPIYLAIEGNGHPLGETDLKVDTRSTITPEDRGMIRLAKGQIRPASSRWFQLIYAAVPLLIVGAWLFMRRR
jgi:hypothetical protein